MLFKKKIIHLWAPGIREGTGGIQAFCRTLVMAVKESFPDHELHVLLKNDDALADDPLRKAGVRFTSVASAPSVLRTPLMALRGLLMGITERPVCVLGAHLHFLPAIQVLRLLTGVRYSGFLYGIEAWNVSSRHRIKAMCAADALIAISGFTRDHVVTRHGVNPALCSLVPCTFDVGRFAIGPKPPELLLRFGIKADQPVMLTVSRLALSERYKGHRQVFVALKTILKTHPDVVYVVAGQGDDLNRLKDEVAVMGLEPHVRFIGHVSVADLPALYRMCDIFVMPSSKEGFGIVFLEAMASGKPVLAGDADGSVDALDHGRLGALVDPNSPDQIASTVCQILERTYPNELMFKPQALREAVAEQFGFARVRRLFGQALRPLVEGCDACEGVVLPEPSEVVQKEPSASSSARAPRIAVLTQLTSPYQVEFFNAINATGKCSLDVIYLTSKDSSRQWTVPGISHAHMILNETPGLAKDALSVLNSADLVVFNYYTDLFALKAIRARAASRQPWVFWGERPGFLHLGILGVLARRILLAPLRSGPVPIWGVGKFGIDGYQREFGLQRDYQNITYFSNLSRFGAKAASTGTERVFLFSGAMIQRKGVEALACAFRDLARECAGVRLLMVGDGPLIPHLKNLLAECASRVEWAGFQPWDKLPDHYARADVFCFPSRYDGWGLAVIEALAAGLPVISTDQTGAAIEFLKTGDNGWFLSAGDGSQLLAAMREAALMPTDKLAEIKKRALNSVAKHSLEDGAMRFIKASQKAILEWR